MNKHTPGPWHSEESGSYEAEDGTDIPLFEIHNDGGDLIADRVSEHDAPLLGSAPELLEACRAAFDHATHDFCARLDQPQLLKLKAAIAKATEST